MTVVSSNRAAGSELKGKGKSHELLELHFRHLLFAPVEYGTRILRAERSDFRKIALSISTTI